MNARAERALIEFSKGLPSALKDASRARALMSSGTPAGDYASALVGANRRGREMGPVAGRSKYWRNEKGRELFRAKARIAGSAEAKVLAKPKTATDRLMDARSAADRASRTQVRERAAFRRNAAIYGYPNGRNNRYLGIR